MPEASGDETAYGIAWCTPLEWDLVREASIDREVFEDSYAEWQSEAEAAFQRFRSQGVRVQRIYVTASDLIAWCLDRGFSVDAKARARYTAEAVRKRARQLP